MSCASCKSKFSSREQVLSCDGSCGHNFHPCCVNISTDLLKYLSKTPGLSWRCDNCVALLRLNLEEVIEAKVSVIAHKLNEMISSMKEDITKTVTEELREVKSQIQEDMSNTTENNKIVNAIPSYSTSAMETKKNPVHLYSTALKSQSAIIIKPKNGPQKNYKTKSDILNNINPIESKINVCSVKHIKNGGIVLGCNDETDIAKVKSLVEDKLLDKYEVEDIKGISPRVRVVGLSCKLDEAELSELIKNQNKKLLDNVNSELKVLKIWPTKRNQHIFQTVLQLDVKSYNNIMSIGKGKLIIGFDICNVFDSIHVKRCYKCNAYGHHSNNCKSADYYCPRCSEKHQIKNCNADENSLKCINCVKLCQKNKDINININHAAWDTSCYVYCQNIKEFKSTLYTA